MEVLKSEADIVYGVTRNLDNAKRRLHNDVTKGKLSAEAEKTILRFLRDLDISKISKHRQYFYLERLRTVGKVMGGNLLSPTGDDIKDALFDLKNKSTRMHSTFSDRSVDDIHQSMKRFYAWYMDGKYLQAVNSIKRSNHRSQEKKPKDIVTQSELKAMLGACNNVRDKTVISILYDSGCRIGEILTLRVKDVDFDEFGMRLTVKGKTGVRKVRAVGDSVPLMREYLQAYSRINPDEYVFIQLTGSKHGDPMKWSQVNTMIRKVLTRAKIEKRIHAHLFRHTRATILAKDVREAPLEATMGWAHGSKMAKVYVHLDADDVDSAILKVYGIEKQIDKEKNVTYVPKVCPRCKEANSNISSYCYKCGLPLDEKALQEFIDNQRHIEREMQRKKLISPEIQAIIDRIPESERAGILASILEAALSKDKTE